MRQLIRENTRNRIEKNFTESKKALLIKGLEDEIKKVICKGEKESRVRGISTEKIREEIRKVDKKIKDAIGLVETEEEYAKGLTSFLQWVDEKGRTGELIIMEEWVYKKLEEIMEGEIV